MTVATATTMGMFDTSEELSCFGFRSLVGLDGWRFGTRGGGTEGGLRGIF